MSEITENKTNQTTNQVVKITSKDELVNLFNQDFSTSYNSIYINSLGKDVGFREITVKELKSLTRTMAANESRKDIVYDAQCALIQCLSLDPSFDIFKISEFDRMKLLLALYQTNMFANEVKFTCEECGAENKYQLDFDKTIGKLNSFDLTPKTYEFNTKRFKCTATLQYPTVGLVSGFYREYVKNNRAHSKKDAQANNTMENVEYVNLFINSINLVDNKTSKTIEMNMRDFPVGQIEEILSVLPQDIFYSENGLLKYIINEFLSKFNDTFDKHECYNCGTIHEKGAENSIQSFL